MIHDAGFRIQDTGYTDCGICKTIKGGGHKLLKTMLV